MAFLKIAWRNILRNYRRSIITILAIAVGFAGLIFAQGLFEGEKSQMLRNSITIFTGHIQLHEKGFVDDPAVTKRIHDFALIEQELRANSNIESYSPRVEGGGLLATENKSMGGFILGISPDRELNTSTISKAIISGRYLAENDTNKAMIGAQLAEKMQLSVGGQIIVLTQAVDGAIAAQKYEIVGIYDTRVEELDGFSLMITLPDAQDLYSLGSDITGVTLKVKNPDILDQTIAELKPFETKGLEIDKWEKFLPEIYTEIVTNKLSFRLMLFIMLVIMAIGIANTISMSMIEREREFGMMMALGTRNTQIFAMAVYESVLLGVSGSVVGSVAGFAINNYYRINGIDFSAYMEVMEMLPGLSPVIYIALEPSFFITTSMWVIAITLLASISPALRASRLEPIEAIHGLHRQSNAQSIPDKLLPVKDIFFLMAWRNIIRNRNRSLITILAIGAGLAGTIFFYSLLNGIVSQMITNTTRYMIGDMQVMDAKYRNDKSPQYTVKNLKDVEEALSQNKDVKIYVNRVEQEAILSSTENSFSVIMLGIEPEKEKRFSRFNEIIKEGRYLGANEKNGILLGDKLAQKLKVAVGDKVVLMSQDSMGSVSSESFRLVGIFDTGADSFDGALAVINIETAKSMLVMDGVSVVMMNVNNRNAIDKIEADLSTQLSNSGNLILSWKDVSPLLEQFILFARDSLNIIAAVIFGVTIFSVINTIFISIIERTREFGLMSALGTNRRRVVWIVFLESLILSALGVIAGNIMGAIITMLLTVFGFDLRVLTPGASMEYMGVGLVIYPVYSVETVIYPSVVIFILSLLTCLYPAWRAASLDPVKALRHV